MDIVLALLAAYVLGGSAWPQIVRNRQFFMIGAVAVAVAMLLGGIPGRWVQTVAFVLLVLAANHASPRNLWQELKFW